jgi:hypothetical protein
MYERETDEATRQAVSCYCVNAYSNPHHSQHTPCALLARYSQNCIIVMSRSIDYLKKSLHSVPPSLISALNI